MKTDKRYWFVLIIPIAAIIAIAVLLIPGKKHHDWDDDEEEENRTERSDFDITEEDIAAIPEELWSQLCVCRLDESGFVQQYSRTLNDAVFRFETSKNCLWGITIGRLIIGSSVERTCYLTALGALPRAATWVQLTAEYGNKYVEMMYDDKRTGQFTVGFNPYDTEHPNPEKYLKGMKRMDELADSLRSRARIELSEERMQERNPAFQQWPNRRAINYTLRLNTLLKEKIGCTFGSKTVRNGYHQRIQRERERRDRLSMHCSRWHVFDECDNQRR